MFIGEYKHNLDSKGRLAVPSKFRRNLAAGFVVTRGVDQCLFLYTKQEWEKLAQKLSGLPLSHSKSRSFARLMLAGAMDVSLDKQGRVDLPVYLREYANLKKSVVVAGLYDRLELWSETSWEKYKSLTEKNSAQIAESLAELGI